MLTRVFEWTRAAVPVPGDELVTKRAAAVATLVEAILEDNALLIDYVAAAVGGVTPRFAQDSELVTNLLAAIRDQQPAFPESLNENSIDLRVCSALVVGEVIERARAAKSIPDDHVLLAAMTIITGVHSQASIAERYLREMLLELRTLAVTTIEAAGTLKRNRSSARWYLVDIKEVGDVPTFWKAALPKLQSVINVLENNAAKDREEINALWWAFNRSSSVAGMPYPEMTVGLSVLCAGLELGDMALIPPWPSMPQLASRTLRDGRENAVLAERSLKDVVAEWTPEAILAFASPTSKSVEIVRNNAVLFPLSWGCLRQNETGDSSWLNDLKKRSNWDPKKKVPPDLLTLQVFNERVAQRLASRIEEEE